MQSHMRSSRNLRQWTGPLALGGADLFRATSVGVAQRATKRLLGEPGRPCVSVDAVGHEGRQRDLQIEAHERLAAHRQDWSQSFVQRKLFASTPWQLARRRGHERLRRSAQAASRENPLHHPGGAQALRFQPLFLRAAVVPAGERALRGEAVDQEGRYVLDGQFIHHGPPGRFPLGIPGGAHRRPCVNPFPLRLFGVAAGAGHAH